MVVVTRNAGLTVTEVSELRRRMRAAGASYKVAKNRLAVLALDGTRFDGIKPLLQGPTALAWSADPVAVAKTAVEFARTAGCGWGAGARRVAVAGCAACEAGGDASNPCHADRGRSRSAGRADRAGPRGLRQEGRGGGGLRDFSWACMEPTKD